jgi:hypothetical protein
VVEGRDRARLLLEPAETVRVRRDLSGEDLQRDVASQAGVARPVDLPHAAGPERLDDLVRTESRAGRKRHVRASPAAREETTTL